MISDMRVVETGEPHAARCGSVGRRRARRATRQADLFGGRAGRRTSRASSRSSACTARRPPALHRSAPTGMPVADARAINTTTCDRDCRRRCTIVRDDALGLPGFDVYVAGERCRSRCARRSLEAGAVDGGATRRPRRCGSKPGRPRFGVDMDTDTIPLEAGIEDRAISFTKGCYVGQEVIVRVMHRGHGRVARRLVRSCCRAARCPRVATRFCRRRSGGRRDYERRGVARRLGAPLALGYVQRDHAAPGTELQRSGGSQARRVPSRSISSASAGGNSSDANSSRVIHRSSWPSIGSGAPVSSPR